jgi:hypothetical protein
VREHAPDCRIAYSHCTCGLGGDENGEPMSMAAVFQKAIDNAAVRVSGAGERPRLVPRPWKPEDLWTGIPEEFQGAELSAPLLAILKQTPRPVSFALVGPPGTGKTRSLWAMLHSMRKAATKDWMGSEVKRSGIMDGEFTERRQTYNEAIEDGLASIDRLRIITEVGEIRASRYDRKALDDWATTERWLAVDDIGAIEPNEWVREALYHLANERRANSLTTVWTSNLTPQKIRDTFGGAIASRILGGAVIETSGADRRVQP